MLFIYAPSTLKKLFKERVSFFLVYGEWIGARVKQIAWTAKWFSGNLFVLPSDSFPMNQEKRHSFLIFTMFPSKTFSKILREKWCKSLRVWFGQLVNYFMTVFIGNWIENFCMVQWRKYNTIVNIKGYFHKAIALSTYPSVIFFFNCTSNAMNSHIPKSAVIILIVS